MDVFVIHPISEPHLVSNPGIDNEFDPLFCYPTKNTDKDRPSGSKARVSGSNTGKTPMVIEEAEIYDGLVKKGRLSPLKNKFVCPRPAATQKKVAPKPTAATKKKVVPNAKDLSFDVFGYQTYVMHLVMYFGCLVMVLQVFGIHLLLCH
ncbi:hypothetical protein Tco_0500807 [Tanacetum coccineum]